nr:MAG TPA: hypothetical protein [Caudoviricetes sp.]
MAGVPALAVGPARARRAGQPRASARACARRGGLANRPATAPPQAATAPATATAIVPIGLSYEWTALRSRSL